MALKLIISGAGIGGLTAALCAQHFGHDVKIFEQASKLDDIGAGIQVPPNAMKVFEALGIQTDLTEAGFLPEAIETRMGRSGMELFRAPLGADSVARWGAAYLHIHRADYVNVLARALEKRCANALQLDQAIVDYTQSETGIWAILSDGSKIEGDVLIAADGIHSPLRTKMLGNDKAVFTGNVAWRAVVPISRLGADAPRPTACAWMGSGKHCVTYRLRQGELANFVGVVEREDWTKESWTEKGTHKEALADFGDWHPTIRKILTEADTLYRWALFDRPPLRTWIDGRIALLGDAAHPMLPFMAQGAAMAVEDAWAVTQKLTQTKDINQALKAYEKLRFGRTSRIQALSRANAKTFHKRTQLGKLATYGPMWLAGKFAPSAIHARQDPIYGYDIIGKN